MKEQEQGQVQEQGQEVGGATSKVVVEEEEEKKKEEEETAPLKTVKLSNLSELQAMADSGDDTPENDVRVWFMMALQESAEDGDLVLSISGQTEGIADRCYDDGEWVVS